MKVIVFTDGACSKNGRKDSRASYAFYFPDYPEYSDAQVVPSEFPQTNNRGELMAINEAVKRAQEKFPANEIDLQIYTDSTYSRDCLTIWLPGWLRNNWKNSKGDDVKNRDLIEDTSMRFVKFKSYTITYVEAHTGKSDELSKNNHIVDRMAVKVLNPEEDDQPKVITNTQAMLPDFPLQLMGPPLSESTLIEWCKNNLDKLDKSALDSALLSALVKTGKKNGFNIEKQKLHRTTLYRLISSNHLISEGINIIKEDE